MRLDHNGTHGKAYLLSLLLLLGGIGVLVSACGQDQKPQPSGPNANVDSNQLAKLAAATMQAYQSYRMEFHGGVPSENVQMSRNMTITADLQFGPKGSTIEMADDGKIEGAPNLMLGVGPTGIKIRTTRDAWFESYDGGNTWYKATGDTPGGFLMLMFGWWWNPSPSPDPSATPDPSAGEQMVSQMTFTDADPRVEQVDGTLTRHIVARPDEVAKTADRLGMSDWNQMGGATVDEVDLWITTDISPTVRQMVMKASGPASSLTVPTPGATGKGAQAAGSPYTLHWKWSQFNADFGEVKDPPPETVKSP